MKFTLASAKHYLTSAPRRAISCISASRTLATTKHHFTNLYIGKNLLQGDGDGRSERTDGTVITGAWVVTTFLGPDQLSAAQRAYAARVNAFLSALAPGTIDLAYRCWFDPDFIVRPAMDEKFQLNDTLMKMYEELQRLMDAGGFKAHPRHQLTYLLDLDLSDAEFREGLPAGT